jgi:membrane protein insertase Oxa1/YidC/SpoIIIJ
MSMQTSPLELRTQLPANFSSTPQNLLVITVLVLIVLNWNVFIGVFVNLLLWIYSVIGGNFGIAIILFTLLIRFVTWPLNAQQMKGAQAMQEMQSDKEWQAIQKKYAKDREKLPRSRCVITRKKGSALLLPACRC